MIANLLIHADEATKNSGFTDHMVISGAILVLMSLAIWWLQVSNSRKYEEHKESEKGRSEAYTKLQRQVYKNKDDIFKNTLSDENNSKENSRMQKSIDEMAASVKDLAKEVHGLRELIAGIKTK